MMRFRRRARPPPMRQAALPDAARGADTLGIGAGAECLRERLSTLLECVPRLILQRLEQV